MRNLALLSVVLLLAAGCDEPKITGQPKNNIYRLGAEPVPLSVSVENVSNPAYQWYANTADSNKGGTLIGEAADRTYLPPTDTAAIRYYYCVIEDGENKLTSKTAKITVTNDELSSDYIVTTEVKNYTVGFPAKDLKVFPQGDTYQWYSNDTDSDTGGTLLDGATAGTYVPPTTAAGATYYYCTVNGKPSTTVKITVTDVEYTVDPSTANYNTGEKAETLAVFPLGKVYQWYSNPTNSNTGGTVLTDATDNTYVPPTDAAGEMYYYCVVDGHSSTTAKVTVTGIHHYVVTPEETAYVRGEQAEQLSVSPAGRSYQWYSNPTNSNTGGTPLVGGTPPANETARTFTPPTDISGVMYYYCVVDGIASTTAKVTVTVTVYTVTPATASYTVGDDAEPLSVSPSGNTYQWYSNDTESNTGGTLLVDETAQTYTPLTDTAGVTYYYCEVDGVASTTAEITVDAATSAGAAAAKIIEEPADREDDTIPLGSESTGLNQPEK